MRQDRSDPTTRQMPAAPLATVSGGMVARNLLMGALKLLVAGFLSPAAFGTVRVTYSLMKIVSRMAELGLGTTQVTLVSEALGRSDRVRARRLQETVLALVLSLATLLVLVSLLAAPAASWVLGDPALEPFARLALLAAGGQLLWRYVASWLSSHQRFGQLSMFLVTGPAVGLIVAMAGLAAGWFDAVLATVVYLFSPIVAAALWWPVLRGARPPAIAVRRPRSHQRVLVRVVRFGRWVYLSRLGSAVRNHITPLLLAQPLLSGSVAAGALNAGLFGFGADLAAEITVLTRSLATVLLPEAARQPAGADLRQFLAATYRRLLPLLALLSLAVFGARPLVVAAGTVIPGYLEYLPALRVFAILYVGNLVSAAGAPMLAVLYALGRPRAEATIEVFSMLLLSLLVPLGAWHFGIEGAAGAISLQRVVSLILLGWTTQQALRSAEATAK